MAGAEVVFAQERKETTLLRLRSTNLKRPFPAAADSTKSHFTTQHYRRRSEALELPTHNDGALGPQPGDPGSVGLSRAPGREESRPGSTHCPRTSGGALVVGEPFNPFGMFNGIWIPDVILSLPGLSLCEKLIYGRLARFAGSDGRCFPSVPTLARELGISERHVQRSIAKLCGAALLWREPWYRRNGSQASNSYLFLYHKAFEHSRTEARQPLYPTEADELAPAPRGDRNVTRGTTEVSPLEDSPLESASVDRFSSNEPEALEQTSAAAAAPDPHDYPLSAARFRDFYPRTTDSVVCRIVFAILAVCPGATDEDIAVSVRLERGQNTPGLWAHILPDHVRRAMLRRLSAEPRQPTCQACGDAGMIWETGDIVCWCPNDCGAAREERRKNPKFMDDWTTYVVEAKTCQEPRNSSGSDEYRPEGGRISGEHSFQTAALALPRIPDVCWPPRSDLPIGVLLLRDPASSSATSSLTWRGPPRSRQGLSNRPKWCDFETRAT